MADKKISALTSAGALSGSEPVPIVQGGVTVKTTVQDIADLAAGGSSVVSLTASALKNLETIGNLDLNTIYIVTNSTPFKVMCKAETVSQVSKTATIVDAVYSGSVFYDAQTYAMQVVSVIDSSGNKPNQYFGVMPSDWVLAGGCDNNVFYVESAGRMGDSCKNNIFEQQAGAQLGDSCVGNTFKQNASGFIFGDNLQNVTVEANVSGDDYTASPDYDFLYNNTYASTIFTDGTANYHRYYDVANDRIVVTLLQSPYTVSYIGGGGGGGITKATASGTDTYTATISGVSSYTDGDTYLIRFTNGNTTGSTININTLGAKTLYRNNDGAIIGGDIWAGAEMLLIYNSTLNGFQCIGTSPNSLFAYVTNADSVSITKGQVVYAFGGTGDRMTVKLANNTSDATSARTVGVVFSTSIGANQKGIIILQGLIDGLSILGSPFVDGDSVYLGATNGAITRTKPYAPNHLVYVGTVTTASAGSAGRMYVRIQNGYEMDELHDVSAQTPANGDVLMYNTSTSLWESTFGKEIELSLISSFRFLTGN